MSKGGQNNHALGSSSFAGERLPQDTHDLVCDKISRLTKSSHRSGMMTTGIASADLHQQSAPTNGLSPAAQLDAAQSAQTTLKSNRLISGALQINKFIRGGGKRRVSTSSQQQNLSSAPSSFDDETLSLSGSDTDSNDSSNNCGISMVGNSRRRGSSRSNFADEDDSLEESDEVGIDVVETSLCEKHSRCFLFDEHYSRVHSLPPIYEHRGERSTLPRHCQFLYSRNGF
ncbi:unnamed protein product [Anisakis simplex]|uniref:Uncharacterized protein n=1 Tax=Anisakis simplex TaxID=6269 RepID=A0A0M3KHF9_ANISI|nr:unnamed protein product [Anisakis simplex]